VQKLTLNRTKNSKIYTSSIFNEIAVLELNCFSVENYARKNNSKSFTRETSIIVKIELVIKFDKKDLEINCTSQ
jgi:hypothetical protein